MKRKDANSHKEKNTIYDLSTRELKKQIRKKTASMNVRISEYRESQDTYSKGEQKFIERTISSLKSATAEEVIEKVTLPSGNTIRVRTGVYRVPKGKRGELGLGLNYKSKAELQKQLQALERFERNDISTPKGKENYTEKVRRQYQTFRNRYAPDMSLDDYENMIDTMLVVSNLLKDYGYEDVVQGDGKGNISVGVAVARQYGHADSKGRQKFAKYVEQAVNESKGKGKTAKDIVNRVASLLRENGEV